MNTVSTLNLAPTTLRGDARRTVAIAAGLVALVAAVYSDVWQFSFVSLDDPLYVTENPQVKAGLTGEGLRWAFTAFFAANWHPLTWLSHMLDVELFGLDAGWHHGVNVLIHAANTLLLFTFLERTTKAPWRSALVAALFAVHPLHVESVAWVSERKDVLSTFLWFALLHAYVGYTRRRTAGRMALVAALLALGLLAKPMLVSAPLTLLLLDAWPLGRFVPGARARDAWPLVREKLPLFAVAAASCAVTLFAQARAGAVAESTAIPFGARLANALLSYGLYLRDVVWPAGLAAFYPHPATTPAGSDATHVVLASVAVVAITAIAAWQWRRRPHVTVGWAWYLVTLAPVIGLLQVGSQARADRYTYVPLVGVFFAIAWLIPSRATALRVASGAAAVLVIGASAAAARAQTSYWRDSRVLYERAIAVTHDNGFAWGNLGVLHLTEGDPVGAIAALQRAVAIQPMRADHWLDLGAALRAARRVPDAANAFQRAAELRPDSRDAHFQLGIALLELEQPHLALAPLEQTVALDERHAGAWAALAMTRRLVGDEAGSLAALERTAAIAPGLARQLQFQLAGMTSRR